MLSYYLVRKVPKVLLNWRKITIHLVVNVYDDHSEKLHILVIIVTGAHVADQNAVHPGLHLINCWTLQRLLSVSLRNDVKL